ncbi:hemin ABC transporter substrate-binding protein [Kordiimonas sp. SCSIO 12610]|uniref:heme/hemin ABC transporter substrate-binding protein n=1 Tax=Kordiimonas sp. SCSIO 12610 TaxID=2829597 RepID=UPI00210D6EDB|nr:ABC transporter substrate-binding protein [Kordiimonas sp. SCSIO 12610]UTW55669.1 ABC transporter substrate-binding protein [Kordiimonas sp. SCSIO 12610]
MRNALAFFIVALTAAQSVSAEQCQTDAKRVITLGGAITEIVYALGEEGRLVGVDTTSSYPAATAKLPKLGYYRAVAAEGLLSLAPDLIIADADAGPDKILDQVEAAGVCLVRTSDGGTIDSILARVKEVSSALGVSGHQLEASIKTKFTSVSEKVEMFESKPRVLFILSATNGTPVVAGSGTEADAIITLAGGVNAGSAIDRYKPLTPEAAIAAKPDYILMMDHVVRQSGGPDKILSIPQIAMTPAGKHKNLIAMDGLLLLGFGPRTSEAIMALAQKIHPEFKRDIATN